VAASFTGREEKINMQKRWAARTVSDDHPGHDLSAT
jgi:hypothetical protein